MISALPRPRATTITSSAAASTGRVRVSRRGGGFGESSTTATQRLALGQDRMAGEERADVAVGPDAEQDEVEPRAVTRPAAPGSAAWSAAATGQIRRFRRPSGGLRPVGTPAGSSHSERATA